MRKQKGSTFIALLIVIVSIVGAVGWVKNIIKLSECDFESPYKAEVIHTVGLFPIVGAVVGYMEIGK